MTNNNFYVEITLFYPKSIAAYYQLILEDLGLPPHFLTDTIMELNRLQEKGLESFFLEEEGKMITQIPRQKYGNFGFSGGVFDFNIRMAVAKCSVLYLDTPYITENGKENRFIMMLHTPDGHTNPYTFDKEYKHSICQEIVFEAIKKLKIEREIILMAGEYFLKNKKFPKWFVGEAYQSESDSSSISFPVSQTIN